MKHLLRTLAIIALLSMSGCGLARIDPYHYLIRSDVILSAEDEERVLSKARLSWTEDGRIRVLHVAGTPYERGYQHGKLLQAEVRASMLYLYDRMLEKFPSEEFFDESFERSRPFIPEDYMQEMRGLAHGSRLPLKVVHRIHALPEISEWGGKKRLKEIVKMMRDGTLGTSCSNLSASSAATKDGNQYVVRILDWGLFRISRLQEFPLLLVSTPENGIPNVNIGWIGYLGAVSGMNAQGITLGEMGYGDPPHETLSGMPMPFLLREVLARAQNLEDVRRILGSAAGTGSFVFLMSDGKTRQAELYVKDPTRFEVYHPGQEVRDHDELLPAIADVSYGGHYNERMTELLNAHHGSLSPQLLMEEIIPKIAMKSNFQNVVYVPGQLQFWVSLARDAENPAFTQPYTFFDLKSALAR